MGSQLQSQPAAQECAGHGCESDPEDIGAELGRSEKSREEDDIDQAEHGRKRVRSKIDRGLSDEHFIVPLGVAASRRAAEKPG